MSSFVRVKNLSRALADPVRVERCDTFRARLRGLMFRQTLAPDTGALLIGDRDSRLDAAIHMLFVPFDLAVFWIADEFNVVDKIIAKAWRAAYLPRRAARYVLELSPSHFADYQIEDKVQINDA